MRFRRRCKTTQWPRRACRIVRCFAKRSPRAPSLYPAATRMMNVDIEFPQNCVRRNAAQEHIQTRSHSVSEASLKASFSEAPSARTLDVVSGRAPSSLQVLALLASSSSSMCKVEACSPSRPLLQPTELQEGQKLQLFRPYSRHSSRRGDDSRHEAAVLILTLN